MAFAKRYSGSMLSRDGNIYRCEIWQDGWNRPGVQMLDYPASSPLTIEWSRTEKYDVICGSTVTLKLLSPSDRQYYDLYTIAPGMIRLDIYKGQAISGGTLIWSGMLDPEHAEEPYTSAENYEVQLTFSDFGILKRLNYDLAGIKTVNEIVSYCIGKTGMLGISLDTSRISTYIGSSVLTLSALSVRSENFYDEEGNPMTLYEVLEGVLRPLSLRCVRKGGSVYLYDINSLCGLTSRQISWAGTDQRISVDKTFNSIELTFSPYAGQSPFPDFEYSDRHPKNVVNLSSNTDPSSYLDYECYSYYPDYVPFTPDYSNVSFTIFNSENALGVAGKLQGAKYFYIQPVLGSTEKKGVAYWFYTGGQGSLSSGSPVRKGVQSIGSSAILETPPAFVPQIASESIYDAYIRLTEEILLDPRYNFESEASDYNEAGNVSRLSSASLIQIYADVFLCDAQGNVLYHYSNQAPRDAESTLGGRWTLVNTKGTWVQGAPSGHSACALYFHAYQEGKDSDVFVRGWQKNVQAYNVKAAYSSAGLRDLPAGQYIKYPPVSGYLKVKIYEGITYWKDSELQAGVLPAGHDLLDARLRWALLSVPELAIVDPSTGESFDNDDVIYKGKIDDDAAESLNLRSVVGTMPNANPSALGLLYRASSGDALSTLTRSTRTDSPEQLLIGSLLSQYAGRKDVLSGTIQSCTFSIAPLADSNLANKVLLPLYERMDLLSDETEIVASEIVTDSYTPE